VVSHSERLTRKRRIARARHRHRILPLMSIALAPHGYAAIDTATGKLHEFAELADKLRWRWIEVIPDELRQMPPHQYVDGHKLRPEEVPVARMLEFVIAYHPESYLAYFRGYQQHNRYLEIGDGWRYWRASFGTSCPHRQRLDACEPPWRLDEGARPIPPEEWGAEPSWPQGSGYGEWKKERGEWAFHPEDPPPPLPPRPQLPRGICSVCGRSVVLKKNGELREHRAPHPGLPPCPGRKSP